MTHMKKHLILIACSLLLAVLSKETNAQVKAFRFAVMSDTHIGSDNAAEDLQRSVDDINNQADLAFVIISGDITEFGADAELRQAKTILDGLRKPWYIIPGNHDTKWSESGGNTFRSVFGGETFSFSHGGYRFLGTNSGPNMRMGPGQVPRENIVWLNQQLKNMDTSTPIVYVNHYPQIGDMANWYEAIDPLKQHNIQLVLCGHGHANHVYDFEEIPGVMCRSNLRAKDSIGGYNIVTFADGKATFEERTPLAGRNRQWAQVPLNSHMARPGQQVFARPALSVKDASLPVKTAWLYEDKNDIGSGMAIYQQLVISTNTGGEIYALDLQNGQRKWTFATKGKVYATPAVAGNRVVVASTDNNIYCLQAATGKPLWVYKTDKPIVGSSLIVNGVAYTGSSDGHFRAIDINTGKLRWEYTGVQGFVEDRPLYYQGNIYFGSWGNDFYALDANSGELKWKWNNGAGNRMYSPAACWPVAANNRVFIVAPDRYMTAFDAATGKVIWRKNMPDKKVRESIGLSADSNAVFVKTMEGRLLGVSPKADSLQPDWQADVDMGYELDPAPIVEKEGVIYLASGTGVVYAVDSAQHKLLWKYKLSNCLVNAVAPLDRQRVLISTMDGKMAMITAKH
ncbi:outer membrane protein assembly factor BamB family protein [Chitinophaga vietnamensis]|uniref:outer membrane protein assembly factor BamB family protein n=1 Tax=Chitinophaga vietnamensis TaxID=2593957 RepID=UPI001F188CAF|nr:PQQ-binding-like beta-propeller repeat protein [Chitinophaga vietnamensis]